jgi:hypothetical protein
MNNLEFTEKEQLIANKTISLYVKVQLMIEDLDDLNNLDAKFGNKKLASQLKAIYPALDKETKKYNEFYQVAEDGTNHFYDVIKQNVHYMMDFNLLDQSFICKALQAKELNLSAIEGIINKILKTNYDRP